MDFEVIEEAIQCELGIVERSQEEPDSGEFTMLCLPQDAMKLLVDFLFVCLVLQLAAVDDIKQVHVFGIGASKRRAPIARPANGTNIDFLRFQALPLNGSPIDGTSTRRLDQ